MGKKRHFNIYRVYQTCGNDGNIFLKYELIGDIWLRVKDPEDNLVFDLGYEISEVGK